MVHNHPEFSPANPESEEKSTMNMSLHSKTRQDIIAENEELRTRLAETADILRAIRSGEVDAHLITGTKGARIATLDGADSVFHGR